MSEKQKRDQFTTPRGVAKFPYLTEPDTKYNADGVYRVALVLEGEDAAKLKKMVDEARKAAYLEHTQEQQAKAPKGKKLKLVAADPPYKAVTDDEGNEVSGKLEFRFKQNATAKSKAKGKTYTFTIPIFDAKGKPLKGVSVYGGTEMKVAFEFNPFYTAKVGSGIGLRLKAVQILKLVSGSGGSAENYGFAEEDGFQADESAFPETEDAGSPASGEPKGEEIDPDEDIPF